MNRMRGPSDWIALTAGLLFAGVATAAGERMSIRFIGNAGIEISDRREAVLIDFPYRSGAFGYQKYGSNELFVRKPGARCFFTHAHDDHFDLGLAKKIGCEIAGPKAVMDAAKGAVLWGPGPIFTRSYIAIHCVSTPHVDVDHCSPRINWNGYRIYISGDVETVDDLLAESTQFDTIVLSHWLKRHVPAIRAKQPKAKILIHHRSWLDGDECEDCLAPAQGEVISLDDADWPGGKY